MSAPSVTPTAMPARTPASKNSGNRSTKHNGNRSSSPAQAARLATRREWVENLAVGAVFPEARVQRLVKRADERTGETRFTGAVVVLEDNQTALLHNKTLMLSSPDHFLNQLQVRLDAGEPVTLPVVVRQTHSDGEQPSVLVRLSDEFTKQLVDSQLSVYSACDDVMTGKVQACNFGVFLHDENGVVGLLHRDQCGDRSVLGRLARKETGSATVLGVDLEKRRYILTDRTSKQVLALNMIADQVQMNGSHPVNATIVRKAGFNYILMVAGFEFSVPLAKAPASNQNRVEVVVTEVDRDRGLIVASDLRK